jgi:hypothetical protein
MKNDVNELRCGGSGWTDVPAYYDIVWAIKDAPGAVVRNNPKLAMVYRSAAATATYRRTLVNC